jgi:hypothetical protein
MDWSMDELECPCGGGGWAEDKAGWAECPLHFEGQLHPESRILLLDDPARLEEENRKSILHFKIREKRGIILELQKSLKAQQEAILKLELELINKTPTVRAMQAATDEIEFTNGDVL